MGGYCKALTPWRIYVNGKPYTGDPRTLALKPHQEIAVVIGTPPKTIPSNYKFPAGLRPPARLSFAAPGWRNWSYAPDLKSGVPAGGVRVRVPSPALQPPEPGSRARAEGVRMGCNSDACGL